jgi:hypothetical protein
MCCKTICNILFALFGNHKMKKKPIYPLTTGVSRNIMQSTYLIGGKRNEKSFTKPYPGKLPQETNVLSLLSLLRDFIYDDELRGQLGSHHHDNILL